MGVKKIYDSLRDEREQAISKNINHKLKVKTRTLKANESLKTAVLMALVDSKYDECESLLENYSSGYNDFTDFQTRVEPYINHCINLTKSVQIKRSFPKITSMPTVKQQELMDKVIQDFNELRLYLVRIEVMHAEVVSKDVLSMTILLRTVMICSVTFTIAAAAIGLGTEGWQFFMSLIEEASSVFSGWLF